MHWRYLHQLKFIFSMRPSCTIPASRSVVLELSFWTVFDWCLFKHLIIFCLELFVHDKLSPLINLKKKKKSPNSPHLYLSKILIYEVI